MTACRRRLAYALVQLAMLLGSVPGASGQEQPAKQPVTVEDLATITRIRNIELSPDGKSVSYLTIRPLLLANRLECVLWLQQTAPGSPALELARFQATAEQVYVETGELKHFGGESAWSPDSRKLAYTSRAGDEVEVRLRDESGAVSLVAGGLLEAELTGWTEDGSAIRFVRRDELPRPADPSMLVTDTQNFFGSSWTRGAAERKSRHQQYQVASRALADISKEEATLGEADSLPKTYEDAGWPTKPDEVKHVHRPVLSPDRKAMVFTGVGMYHNRDPRRASRDFFIGYKRLGDSTSPKELLHSPHFTHYFQWRSDGREVYALVFRPEHTAVLAFSPGGEKVRELARTPDLLMHPSWDAKGTSFVAIRQGTFMPDELVRFDVVGRRLELLARPNAPFGAKDLPQVRFHQVDTRPGSGIFGRLVLPNGYVEGKRYPLVFTTYRAGTGFLEGAVGDEFPILPFAANGFVVYAMDTGESNMLSKTGDLEFTRQRELKPLAAMHAIRKRLAAEGIVDSTRVGITGLSYGSDIAVHAVATTRTFQAAAVSISGHDPLAHILNSVEREKVLGEYGLPYPDEAGRPAWKKLSVAQNADHITTPLLIQSPESEAMFSLETFKALRHYGVPAEWYVYLNEGHVKFQPRSKYLVYHRNLDWMRFWLQGNEDPDPAKAEQYARWRGMRERWEQRRHASTP